MVWWEREELKKKRIEGGIKRVEGRTASL